MAGTYQLWSYESTDIEISNHMILTEKQNRSDIEIMLKQNSKASIRNYLVSKKYGDGTYPNLTYYIRDELEPTYLIYVVINGKKQLTNILFDINSAKNKTEFMVQTFAKYKIPYEVLMETRDDNDIRIDAISELRDYQHIDSETEDSESDETTDDSETSDESADSETDSDYDNIIITAQNIIQRLDRFNTDYNSF
ncbi:Hypothetical protein PACV_81 [Pacmanvirus A23]|uniref:Hypothetical protein n=1 Tax=Pacmanvirus A23 TaxID=1932881 RepID=UPI000A0941F3|nr:Hypothetical protein B9W72_gp081 [Pacmanvirus A23]SIP85798.1 Hypothetical protein PACV_81 [Pacmanvirus A23]